LRKFYTQSSIIGCSTSGEIFYKNIFDESLSVIVMKFDKTIIKTVKAAVKSGNYSFQAGESIANQLKAPDLCGIFLLSDGLNVNGSELVKGLNSTINNDNVVITGGLAGDGSNFKNTRTIFNKKLYNNHVVAVGFYGNALDIGHASKGGWDIFGLVRQVTRSEGNVLYELDNIPALQLYKEYLGEKAADLPSSGLLYPLAINDPSSKENIQLVRTILAVDETQQSLIFAGDIPMGYHAQLMRANFDRLIDSASAAGQASLISDNQDPVVAICISCVGRRLLLGERTEEETESTLAALPQGSIQVGFYSYGELSPFSKGKCELHNQTMTITTFCEHHECS